MISSNLARIDERSNKHYRGTQAIRATASHEIAQVSQNKIYQKEIINHSSVNHTKYILSIHLIEDIEQWNTTVKSTLTTFNKMNENMAFRKHLGGCIRPLLLMLLLSIGLRAQGFIMTYRYDFEKEGFGAQVPLQGVTVNGTHLLERYEPMYDGSTTKKLNYMVDFTAKSSTETETAFLKALMQTLPSNSMIRQDLSSVQFSKNGYPYRSLKTSQGNLFMSYYFFYRRDELVVLSFQCLLANEDWLSNAIQAAVENFVWLEQLIEVKEIGVSFKLPYEMSVALDARQKKIRLELNDPEYSNKANFWASIEFLASSGKIDTVAVRKAFDKELEAQSSTYTYDYHIYNTRSFNPDLICDKYVLYYNEPGVEDLMKMSIYQFYTPKGILRFIHTEYYTHRGKLSGYITNLLTSLKYIG
jgi:hypothetical protein